jgi:tetratricopeptide (TPR) repeat protein
MPLDHAPTSILLGRFRRLARRDAHTWQGGIIRWPFWIDSPDGGRPIRPWGALWVTKPDGLVGFKLAELGEEPSADLAVAALVDLALRYQGQLMGRPGRIEVVDAALGAAVVAALGDPGVAVDIVPDLSEVKEAVAAFVEFQGRDSGVPGLLATKGLTLDDVRAFASAAVRFHRAEPWQHLANEDLVAIEMAGLDKAARVAIVMGNGGMQFGMATYPSMAAAEAMLAAGGRPDLRSTHWAVTFSLPEEVPMPDLLLWEGEQLPLATPDSFPVAIGYASGDRVSRPSRALLRSFTAIMSALAETTEAEMDGGRWSKRVVVGGADAEITLSLPGLLDEVRADAERGALPRDLRANERVHAEIGRFLRDKEFKSLDEANAVIQARFTGPADAMPSTASTPAEQAQELVYQAFDSVGRRRIVLARRALELWPDCADAYVIQAELVATPERALPLYEAGIRAGDRALAALRAESEAPTYWSRVETRPYMRARFGLAETLAALGRHDEAIAEFGALLELNPSDNQGARYTLLEALVGAGRSDEAVRLLEQYADDASAVWMFTWALIEFRSGRREAAGARLADALKWNEFVPEILAIPVAALPPGSSTITLGGAAEAVEYARGFGEFWRETPGAMTWISETARKSLSPRGGRRGRPGRPGRGRSGKTRRS